MDRFVTQLFEDLVVEVIHLLCAVGDHLIHLHTQIAQRVHKQRARQIRARQKDLFAKVEQRLQTFEHAFSDESFRHRCHNEAFRLERFLRLWADGADLRLAEAADVQAAFAHRIEERLHPVDTREDDPVVIARFCHRVSQLRRFCRRIDRDRRCLPGFAASLLDHAGEGTGLLARTRYQNALTKERLLFKPAEGVAHRHHLADNDDRR